MRLVRSPEDLEAAFQTAASEAQAAFSDGSLYVEKALVGARHVEIQVLGDGEGGVLTLGERDCSIQRRHQKLVEESPSPAVSSELRAEMEDAARRACAALRYRGAGTLEFLLDEERRFYFIEMNTRLQVEHPVTELVTGIDLVQWQIRIAAGERLPFAQADVAPQGWAIECRITSEDPANGFLPSTGRVSYLHLPSGPGVRWDGGIEAGSEVGLFYDPMLAKLIVHGRTRELAIARMRRALLELTVDGVETSRDFHLRVMEDEEFRRGDISIQWLEQRLPSLLAVRPPPAGVRIAAIAAALFADRDRRARPVAAAVPAGRSRANGGAPATEADGWRRAARLEALRPS
jgi:acetyl-CoA carboxylase biotin carboxylase subunit